MKHRGEEEEEEGDFDCRHLAEKKKKRKNFDLRFTSHNPLIPPPPRDLRGRLNTDPLVCFYQ